MGTMLIERLCYQLLALLLLVIVYLFAKHFSFYRTTIYVKKKTHDFFLIAKL